MVIAQKDINYIKRCFHLAKRGTGHVKTNPLVGACIVHNDRIIAEGHHHGYGKPHAEIDAFNNLLSDDYKLLSKSTLYVNLEPCNHFGKTPPCSDAIIKAGIPHVVIAMEDPHPLVAGKGVQKLKTAGIRVDICHTVNSEAQYMNRHFLMNQKAKRPYIYLKWAQSADGFIGIKNEQIAISVAQSAFISHQIRAKVDGIVIGSNTLMIDNPLLNVRAAIGPDPRPVVLYGDQTVDLNKQIFNSELSPLVFGGKIIESKINVKQYRGLKSAHDLQYFFDMLLLENIGSILVEGGSKTLQFFIDAGYWDETLIINNPKELGQGIDAPRFDYSSDHSYSIEDDRHDHYTNTTQKNQWFN